MNTPKKRIVRRTRSIKIKHSQEEERHFENLYQVEDHTTLMRSLIKIIPVLLTSNPLDALYLLKRVVIVAEESCVRLQEIIDYKAKLQEQENATKPL